MKHLQKFEELSPQSYRTLRNRSADYPWTQFGAKSPEESKRGMKLGSINKLSKEGFEREFYKKFPIDDTKITVYDSMNPKNKVELSFHELKWKANWAYFDLVFKQPKSPFYGGGYDVYLKFQGDLATSTDGDAYTMERGERLNFKGEILPDEKSQQLLKSMFKFGMGREQDPIEVKPEEEPIKKEQPSLFGKIKSFWNK